MNIFWHFSTGEEKKRRPFAFAQGAFGDFFGVNNPQKDLHRRSPGVLETLRSAQSGKIMPFLRIDMQKVKQSEHLFS